MGLIEVTIYWKLIKNEVYKNMKMFFSYPINAIGQIILFFLGSTLILLSLRLIFSDSITFYNFLFLPIISSSISSLSNSYKFDNLIGVTDQLYSSKAGLEKIYFTRYCIEFLFLIIPTILLIMLARGFFYFEFKLLTFIGTLIILFFGCYFLGKALLGLNFLYRNVESITQIINILISGLFLLLIFQSHTVFDWYIFLIPFLFLVYVPSLPFGILNANIGVLLLLIANFSLSCTLTYFVYKKIFFLSKKRGTIGLY